MMHPEIYIATMPIGAEAGKRWVWIKFEQQWHGYDAFLARNQGGRGGTRRLKLGVGTKTSNTKTDEQINSICSMFKQQIILILLKIFYKKYCYTSMKIKS